jgi:hypothetical protein
MYMFVLLPREIATILMEESPDVFPLQAGGSEQYWRSVSLYIRGAAIAEEPARGQQQAGQHSYPGLATP